VALIRAKEWGEKNFAAGSRPTALTVSRWIKNGSVNGKIIGGAVYVDELNPFPECEYETPQSHNENKIPPEFQEMIDAGIITQEECLKRLKIVYFNGQRI